MQLADLGSPLSTDPSLRYTSGLGLVIADSSSSILDLALAEVLFNLVSRNWNRSCIPLETKSMLVLTSNGSWLDMIVAWLGLRVGCIGD